MRDIVRLAAVAALLACSFLCFKSHAQPPGASGPKHFALLVGVNHYENRGFVELRWPENDAEDLGAELKRIGFDKVLVLKGSFAADHSGPRA
jgi:hypothetical protein